MKKWIAMLLMCTMLFALIACGKDDEQGAPAPTQNPVPTQTQEEEPAPSEEAEEPTPSPSEEVVQEGYTYTSTTYGFTVTMPEEWRETCIIEEENMAVAFYSKANRHLVYGDVEYDAGELFRVFVPEDDMKTEDGYVFPDYEVIGQFNGADLLVMYPTDIQYNIEKEDLRAEYQSMQEQVAEVVSSISFG